MYNFEGTVNGLSVVDFPGVDDHDKAVVNISSIFLQLAQIVVLIIDYKYVAFDESYRVCACMLSLLFYMLYRRIFTQAAMEWIEQLDKSGAPILLCLTHGDKLYADKCINEKGKLLYTDDDAKRVIGNEFEVNYFDNISSILKFFLSIEIQKGPACLPSHENCCFVLFLSRCRFLPQQ